MHEIPDPTEPADEFDPLGDWQADFDDGEITHDDVEPIDPSDTDDYLEPSLVAGDHHTYPPADEVGPDDTTLPAVSSEPDNEMRLPLPQPDEGEEVEAERFGGPEHSTDAVVVVREPMGEIAGEYPREAESADQDPALPSFEPYRAQFHAVVDALDDNVLPRDIPGYLDSGTRAQVFVTDDGRVLKVPRGIILNREGTAVEENIPLDPESVRHMTIDPLLRGRGATRLEQIVTYTDDDPRGIGIVCEFAPGKPLTELPQDEIDQIPKHHFDGLMTGYTELIDNDLRPDISLRNLPYDPRSGFTLIDYGPISRPARIQTAADLALHFAQERYGSVVAPHLTRGQRMDMPRAAYTFYESYRDAFGGEAAERLLAIWARGDFRPSS